MNADFEAVEARLWAILAPYRDRLEEGTVYGLATLKRPEANSHQFFAGVRVAKNHVALHLMPIYSDPALLDRISPALRAHVKGKTTFNFTVIDEAVFAELEALTSRCFDVYMAGSASG